MSKIALVPLFTIKDGQLDAFIARICQHRDNCLKLEPGCRHFDVNIQGGQPNEVLLYEIYDDEDALAAHREYPHFKEFQQDTGPMVASVTVSTWKIAG